MKRLLVALSAVILVIALIAVISSPPLTNVVVTSEDMRRALETNDGIIQRQITVNGGDSITITLYSYLGDGMRWSASVANTSVLKQDGPRELIYDAPPIPVIVFGPGKEIWTFKALDTGVVTITMTYSAGPDGIQNVNTLELVVEVDGG